MDELITATYATYGDPRIEEARYKAINASTNRRNAEWALEGAVKFGLIDEVTARAKSGEADAEFVREIKAIAAGL